MRLKFIKHKYLLLVYFVILILFLGIVYVYRQTIVFSSKQEALDRFAVNVGAKVAQLNAWYFDELLDAKILSQNYELVRRLSFLTGDNPRNFDETLLSRWLNSTKLEHTYHDILVVSTNMEILFSTNNEVQHIHDKLLQALSKSAEQQDVLSTNFYCNSQGERIISFVGPVFNSDGDIIAFVSFNMNAQEYLFPRIEKRFAGLHSSATFVASIKSDSLSFMNLSCNDENDSFCHDAGLHNFTDTSSDNNSNFKGYVHETKWRDKTVIVYWEEVSDTPWVIISKTDKDELFASIISRSITFYLFLFAVFVALVVAIYTVHLYVLRKQSLSHENLLEEQKRQLQTLLSNLPGMAYRCKNDGKWTMEYVSQGVIGLLGYDPHEIIDNRVVAYVDLIVADDRETVAHAIEEAIEKNDNFEVEYRIHHKSGHDKWMWERGCAIWNEEGQVVAIEGFVSDISEKIIAEKENKYHHNLLNTIIENIPDAVYLKDKDGRKIIANRADLRNMGVDSMEDVIGKTDFDIFPFDIAQKFNINDEKVLQEGISIINNQERLENSDGTYKWLNTSKIPFKNENGNIIGLIGIGHDITEKIEMMEELIKAKEKAEESDRLKTAFLANMSHEIRTPLNSILGFTDLIIQLPDTDQAEKETYSEIVKKNADSLLQIINDIIDISSLETGQMRIVSSNFSVNSLLDVIYREYKDECKKLGENGVELRLLAPDREIEVELDRNRVSQILTNLITNAIKFTDKGYIEFGVTHYNSKYVHFKVEDTGLGISPDKHELIFQRFRQVGDKESNTKGGNGLGLSIVKNLVELMGGKIDVKSRVDKGSCFHFYLLRKLKRK